MSTVYIWNVKCDTDGLFYKGYTESEEKPTVCPNDASHGVVAEDTYLIKFVRETSLKLNNANEDGRVIVSPGMFPDYMNPYFTSEGDDFNNGSRGGGTLLTMSHSDGSPVENVTEIRFVDYVQILGGHVRCQNANLDDYLSFDCIAPATPAPVANGGSTGNCNLVAVAPGANIIVPAPGDGAYDVDLTSPANANLAGNAGQPVLVTQATPVPSYDDDGSLTGYWNWDRATGTITPSYTGEGGYNLYDFQITLSRYIHKLCVYSDGAGAVFKQKIGVFHRGGPLLPHWICRLYTTRASSHAPADPDIIYTVVMSIARKNST